MIDYNPFFYSNSLQAIGKHLENYKRFWTSKLIKKMSHWHLLSTNFKSGAPLSLIQPLFICLVFFVCSSSRQLCSSWFKNCTFEDQNINFGYHSFSYPSSIWNSLHHYIFCGALKTHICLKVTTASKLSPPPPPPPNKKHTHLFLNSFSQLMCCVYTCNVCLACLACDVNCL